MRVPAVVIVVACAGCGKVQDKNQVDAAVPPDMQIDAAIDAGIDAPPDAPPNITFTSVTMFPSAHATIVDFSATELAQNQITASGVAVGGTGLTCNVDAPCGSSFMSIQSPTQIPILTFATPIHAAGISTTDVDFGNDNIVNVTVEGLDANNAVVVTFTRPLQPANSGAEENGNALFVGWQTASNVVAVRFSIDQGNSTLFDNFVFQH